MASRARRDGDSLRECIWLPSVKAISPDCPRVTMVSGGTQTVSIIRRMKRVSIGHWPWNVYDPTKARPEELMFELLDDREKTVGEIVFGKIGLLKGTELTTPWGRAKIELPKMNVKISINDKELVRINMSWLGGKTDFVFADGAVMQFHRVKGTRNNVEYSEGKGAVSFTEERGALPEGHPGLGVQMTKEEVLRLPKGDRPRSTESREYIQYRITTLGELPAKKEDIHAALAIFAGLGLLMDELSK